MQHDGVYDCKQTSAGGNADGEDEDGGDCKSATAPETASRIAEILYESGGRHGQKHRRFSPRRSTPRIGGLVPGCVGAKVLSRVGARVLKRVGARR